jgi:diguanylate cyclase (GGDEF)-like protein
MDTWNTGDSVQNPPRLSLGASPAKILVVEDDRDVREALVEMLEARGYETLEAASGFDAQAILDGPHELDLVLLDMKIPGPDGYEILRYLGSRQVSREIPVICVSAHSRVEDQVAGLKLGAADFIAKPFDFQELVARIGRTLRVKRTLDRLSHAKNRAEHLALTDPLTGLPNRRALEERLAQEIERARRYAHQLGCLVMDLDRFKSINDSLGHAAGDAVLRKVAQALKDGLRSFDFVARYGGDEFVAVLPGADLDGTREAGEALRELVSGLEVPIDSAPSAVRSPTVSVGVASYNSAADESGDALIERADAALLRAKRGGRNRIVSAT